MKYNLTGGKVHRKLNHSYQIVLGICLMLFVSLVFCCLSQAQKSDTVGWVLKLPSIWVTNEDLRESFIQRYADSLNDFDTTKAIPAFVFKYDFDNVHFSSWWGPHHPISLRKLIFDNVDNKILLREVIKMTSSPELDKVITPDEASQIYIPFYRYSTRELAKIRLQEIHNEGPWVNKSTLVVKGYLNGEKLAPDSSGINVVLQRVYSDHIDLIRDSSSYSFSQFQNSIGLNFSYGEELFWTSHFTYEYLSGLVIEIRIVQPNKNNNDSNIKYTISENPSGHGEGRYITVEKENTVIK